MQAADKTLPAGAVYDLSAPADPSAAPPDAPAHLSETLLAALYGSAIKTLIFDQNTVNVTVDSPGETGAPPRVEIAIFLSKALHPGEIAVFRCADAHEVAAVAGLCRARLDTIRRAWAGSEYAEMVEHGVVVVEGSYVFLVVAEDAGAVVAAGRRVCA